MLNFGVLPLVEAGRLRDVIVSLLSGRLSGHSARLWQFSLQNLALYNKYTRPSVSGPMCDRLPWNFDVQTSYKPLNYLLGIIFAVNIKFPRATYHTIVPSTEKLYCLSRVRITN